MYQLAGEEVLLRWLARQTDAERRLAMLEWLVGFAADPVGNAQRVPGVRAPVYIAVVPLAQPVVIRFVLVEQFRTIGLIAFTGLP